ncbi:hypothetical protein [Fuscovulum ytuae]|uniref:Uncharacterized protein n=1 Tax=Fuscovulum ytuae TaxID=3042299 RepID=A0ABY8Q8L2_9RHOB|nr:hypothetical protein [Fuscovulum sp. YMD61]WGV16615.1 hypothetical protein QF092_02020 [Fuscovulum sp. YMD61]
MLGPRPALSEALPADADLAEAQRHRQWCALSKAFGEGDDPSHVNLDWI